MNTLELRSAIVRQVQDEKDPSILEAIWNMLRRPLDTTGWDKAVVERALEAEEEIKAGLGMNVDEAFKDIRNQENQ